MLNVGNLFASLSLVTSDFTSGLNSAIAEAKSASAAIGGAMKGSFSGINQAAQDLSVSTKGIGSNFKDVGRVVQGIMISQVFYAGASAIKDATKELFSYNAELENTNIAFKYLLGSADKGKQFVVALQDFAAKTPFTTETASNAARMLLSMGFAANQVLPTLRILSDASAVSGATPEMFNRIVYALGQIKTTGKLMTRDLMQLAQAGIPVYDILQKKLHLTADQMRDIGKQGIDSGTAIQAILSGLQEKYSGASQEVSKTLTGLLSTLKDDFLIVGNLFTNGITEKFKSVLTDMTNGLEKLRQIGTKNGLGGMLNALFPPEMQTQVRAFIEYVNLIIHAVGQLLAALAPIGREVMNGFIIAFNAAGPVILAFLNAITFLIHAVTSCTPVLRTLVFAILGLRIATGVSTSILMLVRAVQGLTVCGPIATIVSLLAKAVRGLAIACMENPLTAVFAVLAGVILSIALSSKSASQWLDRLAESIGRLFGFNVKDLWNPTDASDVSQQISQFYGNLADLNTGQQKMGDGADGAADKAGKAGKAAKGAGKDAKDGAKDAKEAADLFTASFDEIHQIPNDKGKDSGGKGGDGGGGDPGGGSGGNPGGAPTNMPTLPKIPDFKPDNQTLPKLTWPVIPPFPGWPIIPPLPKIPIDDWGKDLVRGLQNVWDTVADVITQPWPAWAPLPIPDFDPVYQKVRQGLGGIGDDVIDGLRNSFGKVPSICADFGNKLNSGLRGAFAPVPSICAEFGNGLATGIRNAFNKVPSICVDFGNKFSHNLAAAATIGVVAFIQALQPMNTQLSSFLKTATMGFGVTLTSAINITTGAINNLATRVTSFTTTSSVSLNGWFMTESTGFTTFSTTVRNIMNNLWQNVSTNSVTWWNNITNEVNGAFTNIETDFTTFGTTFTTSLETLLTTINTDVTTATTTMQTSLETFWTTLQTDFNTFTTNLTTTLVTTLANVTQDTESTCQNLAAYTTNFWNTLYATAVADSNSIVAQIQSAWSTAYSDTVTEWSAMYSYISNELANMHSRVVTVTSAIEGAFQSAWQTIYSNTVGVWNSIVTFFSGVLTNIQNNATSAMNSVRGIFSDAWQAIQGIFNTNNLAVLAIFGAMVAGLITGAGNLKERFSGIFGGIAGIVEGAFAGMRSAIAGAFSGLVSGVNAIISSINAISIDVPSWVPGFGGDHFGFSIGMVAMPGFAEGGIIDRDQLIRVGEGNKREAVIPLENSAAMKPFAEAVAERVNSSAGAQQTGTGGAQPILYVGNLIADERSLKLLERKLQVIRVHETQRRGGR